MANPQPDKYTKISNEILEYVIRCRFNATQLKIITLVWRYTYGFQRKEHDLSLGFIAEAINTTKKVAKREIDKLIDWNVIVVIKGQTNNIPRKIAFNKDYDAWSKCVSEGSNWTTQNIEGSNQTTPEGSNQTTPEGSNWTTKKEIIKEKIKKEDFRSVFDHYQALGLINHRSYTADMQRAIESAMKNNNYDTGYCKTLLDRHKTIVEMTKSSEYKVKARSLHEFFGQKVFGAKNLICSEYEEGGKLYEKHLRNENPDAIDLTGFEVVYQDG